MSLINYSANFNAVELSTAVPGLTVLATDPYSPAKRKLTMNGLARTSKAKTNSGFYNEKAVTVRVGITQATRDLAEASFDTLMSLLQGLEKDLILSQAGGARKYIASYSDYVMRDGGTSYIELDLIFETSDHFGYDVADTLLLQVSGFTSAQKTDQITVRGSAAWQVPKITITLTAVSGGTTKYISIGNDATGQTCVVTRTWSAGDVLEIDAYNQTVKVNGAEVAFTGAIPEWAGAPGGAVGYVTYSDNFTSRTWSNTMNYKKRYV